MPLTRTALCGDSHSSYRTSVLVSSCTTQHGLRLYLSSRLATQPRIRLADDAHVRQENGCAEEVKDVHIYVLLYYYLHI